MAESLVYRVFRLFLVFVSVGSVLPTPLLARANFATLGADNFSLLI